MKKITSRGTVGSCTILMLIWCIFLSVWAQQVGSTSRCLTYEKVRGQRRHHEARERLLLLVPDVAEPRQVVGVHQPHDEDDDGLDGGDGPGGDVEVGAVHLDGLVAPL